MAADLWDNPCPAKGDEVTESENKRSVRKKGDKMSKRRDLWWGYIKRVLYAYPECSWFEREAVQAAVWLTERMTGGKDRLKVIELVYFSKTHKLAGAALQIPCSYETAKRWQQDFIRETARNFKCDGLLKD